VRRLSKEHAVNKE